MNTTSGSYYVRLGSIVVREGAPTQTVFIIRGEFGGQVTLTPGTHSVSGITEVYVNHGGTWFRVLASFGTGGYIEVNQTPVVSDFTIGNLTQTVGSITPVTITPLVGRSTGAITILYNGSTTLPTAAGTYPVTFNVAASTGWNAATGLAGGTLTILQTVPENRFEFYWVDQHGSLVTTSGGVVTKNAGSTLTITAQAAGYTVRQWHLNGINTGQSGNTFNFSSTTPGRYTIGLFVEKNSRLYNTNITITVQ
jgi:hypothetical protein